MKSGSLQGEVNPVPERVNFGYVTAVPATVEPLSKRPTLLQTRTMSGDSTARKDTLKVEKASLLILTLCVLVLVGLLVFKPF